MQDGNVVVRELTSAPWAKSRDREGRWLSLRSHHADAQNVARWLLANWVPRSVLESIAPGTDIDLGTKIARFLAGVHDVGKVGPAFTAMDPVLHARMEGLGFVGAPALSGRDAHHTLTGYHLVVAFLMGKGMSKLTARTWATVVAGHHGAMPSQVRLNRADPRREPSIYGDASGGHDLWREVATRLLDEQWERSGLAGLSGAGLPPLPLSGQVVVGGLVIMVDWIASNTTWFPLVDGGATDPGLEDERAVAALGVLNLPGPWTPLPPPADPVELFRSRFPFFERVSPRPFQLDAVHLAQTVTEPSLVVLEAAPGEGKTEAALAVAEVLAARFGLGGILFALPTMATADAMFSRTLKWLDHVGEEQMPVGASVWLGHSRRRLNREYRGLGSPVLSEVYDGDGAAPGRVVAHEWLTRKKALLATTVVSTVDQVLLAALSLKHGALRLLGVAGKVVVVDEVHAFDPFVRTHLCVLLRWLAELRVPVILASATLPSAIRAELLAAYAPEVTEIDPVAGYPRLTAVGVSGASRILTPRPSGRASTFELGWVGSEPSLLAAELGASLREGGCALVVRNTVESARRTAEELHSYTGWPVECHHSRFMAADRSAHDDSLLARFGPPEAVARREGARPERVIIVATQVAEMSLDVDFDIVATDLAPMDAMLQRIGRCHHHEGRARPRAVATPRVLVISDLDQDTAPETMVDRGSRAVYGLSALLRAASALHALPAARLSTPEQIAPLVERAFSDDVELVPAAWRAAFTASLRTEAEELHRRRTHARAGEIATPEQLSGDFGPPSLIGWNRAGEAASGEDESSPSVQAAVRDGTPSVELVVLETDAMGPLVPERITGELVRLDPEAPVSSDQADAMCGCVVRVAVPRGWDAERFRAQLVAGTPEAWRDEPRLCRWPVLLLDPTGKREFADLVWTYSETRGLEVVRR